MTNMTITDKGAILDFDAATEAKMAEADRQYQLALAKADGAREVYRLAMELLEGLAGTFDSRECLANEMMGKSVDIPLDYNYHHGQRWAYGQALKLVSEAIEELHNRS